MPKKKIVTHFLVAIMILTTLTGCKSSDLPLPVDYYVPHSEEEDDATKTDDNKPDVEVEEISSPKENVTKPTEKGSIRYFLDISNSMRHIADIEKVNIAASNCAAGYSSRHYYVMNDDGSGTLEVNEQIVQSSQYQRGAAIDLISSNADSLEIDKAGVNIITTDLYSDKTTSSELGKWLAETGCEAYSFYVFNFPYSGDLWFQAYTSATTMEEITVTGELTDREFLMIVFGNNDLVNSFDESFKEKLEQNVKYETCHISMETNHYDVEEYSKLEKFTPSKYFQKNLPNVKLSNNNYLYRLRPVDMKNVEWTSPNTFVFEKNSKSGNDAKNAVKAVLYAIPESGKEIPNLKDADNATPNGDNGAVINAQNAVNVNVKKYDAEEGVYKDSEVTFDVTTEAYIDGVPSVKHSLEDTEEDADSSKDTSKSKKKKTPDPEKEQAKIDTLNEALGGNIVAKGPAFVITAENTALPKGLYAVEIQLTFESANEIAKAKELEAAKLQKRELQKFAQRHTATLNDYCKSLKNDCKAYSFKSYEIVQNNHTTAFRKLLEFEKLIDEIIAAADSNDVEATTEPVIEPTTIIRLIIDNR